MRATVCKCVCGGVEGPGDVGMWGAGGGDVEGPGDVGSWGGGGRSVRVQCWGAPVFSVMVLDVLMPTRTA